MKIEINTDAKTLNGDPLYSNASFELLSDLWLKVGWNQKYPYTFTWMGRPIIQAPEDILRIQEVIYRLKPDIIIETGVAHGGSLIFYASLCKAMGVGHVIGVDIEIREHNREAIEAHELHKYITLIEGDSTAPDIVDHVHRLCARTDKVLVILDSCHSYEHVAKELMAYHDLIRPGFYIIVQDGNMSILHDVPRGTPDWEWDNPSHAALEFVKINKEFVIEELPRIFNESTLTKNITYHTNGFLRRT